jgi:hypothetical protein
MTYAQPGQEGSVEISYTLKCEEPLICQSYLIDNKEINGEISSLFLQAPEL